MASAVRKYQFQAHERPEFSAHFTADGQPAHVALEARMGLPEAIAELTDEQIEAIAAKAEVHQHSGQRIFLEVVRGMPPMPSDAPETILHFEEQGITASYTLYVHEEEGRDKRLLRELRRIEYLQKTIMPMLEMTDRAGSMQFAQSMVRSGGAFVTKLQGLIKNVEALARNIERSLQGNAEKMTPEQKYTAVQTIVQQIKELRPTDQRQIGLKTLLLAQIEKLQQSAPAPGASVTMLRGVIPQQPHRFSAVPPNVIRQNVSEPSRAKADARIVMPLRVVARNFHALDAPRAEAPPNSSVRSFTVMRSPAAARVFGADRTGNVSALVAATPSLVAVTIGTGHTSAPPVTSRQAIPSSQIQAATVTPASGNSTPAATPLAATASAPLSVVATSAPPQMVSVQAAQAQTGKAEASPQTSQGSQNRATTIASASRNTSAATHPIATASAPLSAVAVSTQPQSQTPRAQEGQVRMAQVQALKVDATPRTPHPQTPPSQTAQVQSLQQAPKSEAVATGAKSLLVQPGMPSKTESLPAQPVTKSSTSPQTATSPKSEETRPFDKVSQQLGHPPGCACAACSRAAKDRSDGTVTKAERLARAREASKSPSQESVQPPVRAESTNPTQPSSEKPAEGKESKAFREAAKGMCEGCTGGDCSKCQRPVKVASATNRFATLSKG